MHNLIIARNWDVLLSKEDPKIGMRQRDYPG